jgi:hypothetical protein
MKYEVNLRSDLELHRDVHSNRFLKLKYNEDDLLFSVSESDLKEWIDKKRTLWSIISKQNFIYKNMELFDIFELRPQNDYFKNLWQSS